MQLGLGNNLCKSGLSNPDKLSLDLNFAVDQSFSKPSTLAAAETQITSRKGPAPVFSRGTFGTMVGSDGLIKYGPENLVKRSNSLPSSDWNGAGGTSISSTSILSPDGISTLALVTVATATTNSAIYQLVAGNVAAGTKVTISFWLKAGTANTTRIVLNGASSSLNNMESPLIYLTSTLTRYSHTFTVAAADTGLYAEIGCYTPSLPQVGDFYIWGAQFERSSTARQYLQTTTGPVYGPRFDYDPISRTNILRNSNDFNDALWEPINEFPVRAQNQTDPYGFANSAWTLDDQFAGNDGAAVNQSLNITPSPTTNYVFSVFAKQGTADYFDVYSFFQTTTKGSFIRYTWATSELVAGSADGGGVVPTNVTKTSLSNGWYRFSFTVNDANDGNNIGLIYRIYPAGRDAGKTGTTIFYGSQIEIGSTATAYIPTTNAAVTVRDCKGLLIEETRTNIITRSQDFTTGWTPANLQTVTSGSTSPAGDSTACSLVENDLSGIHNIQLASPSAVTAGSPYTGSVYVKANGATSFQLGFSTTGLGSGYANFILSGDGSIGTLNSVTASIQRLANGWYRCSITVASAAGSSANSSYLVITLNDNNSSSARLPSYSGDNATGIFVWGAQLETGSFPTSYIPTTTGTVARSADVCSITSDAFTGMFNQSAGTFESKAMIANLIGNLRGITQIDDGTNANILRHIYGLSDGGFRSLIRANSDTITTLSTTLGAASTIQKRAIAYEGTSFASVTNGGTVSTATRTMPVNLSTLRIGNIAEGSFYLSGHIASIRYYKKRLSDAKLQSITA